MRKDGRYRYVVIGGGLTGSSAIEGIRELDQSDEILLVSAEPHLPYDRPPLTKKLWFGKLKEQEIFLHDQAYFDHAGVDVLLGRRVIGIDTTDRRLAIDTGEQVRYEKLLIATGGTPRPLAIPGGTRDGVVYFRTLDDFVRTRTAATPGTAVTVIGGGFIGSEIAAALAINQVRVTMIYPDRTLAARVFPEELSRSMQGEYVGRGIVLMAGDTPVAIEPAGPRLVTHTRERRRVEGDLVVVGIGIDPNTSLAKTAGLAIGNGILVNELLETSRPAIYAAGDNAYFPYPALERSVRIEHWDNARSQGRQAGRNMAGANEPFTHMPYFFSDLFDFGYEAVGDVRASLDTVADWQDVNRRGVIYYLDDSRVRGVMLCNVWDKIQAARELIRRGGKTAAAELHHAIT